MSRTQWHYAAHGQARGPVSDDELARLAADGTIGPDTLVWTEGMPDWAPARDATGLFPGAAPVPPPVPASVAYDPTHQPPSTVAAPPPAAPPTVPGPVPEQRGDATGGLIPYKNPAALAAYYLSIAALIPGVGLLTGLAAVGLGIFGLRARKRQPHIRGAAHAWIGIILGGLLVVAQVAGIALAFGAMTQINPL